MKFYQNIFAKLIFSLLLVGGIIVVASTATFAQEKEETVSPKLAKGAKISMADARATALKSAPGKIEGEELEKEHGKLVYSFDIRNEKGTISEVWVSAKSGKIIKIEEEDAAAEAKEKADDIKAEQKKTKKKDKDEN